MSHFPGIDIAIYSYFEVKKTMLKQASVSDLITDKVSREIGYVVITMRRYPRFVNRSYRDEYVSKMSPSNELHDEWLKMKRKYNDHDGAFRRSKFELRFDMPDEGLLELDRLCKLAKERDVYFICQCQTGCRCHRELLLLLAKALFKVKTDPVYNDYSIFKKRIPAFKKRARLLLKPTAKRR